MMTRKELEALSLEDLRAMASHYGVQPLGSHGKSEAWINVLTAFPYRAIDQMREGIGLHSPGIEIYKYITVALDMIGKPTESQMGLLRLTKEEEYFEDEQMRFYQDKLYKLYRVKTLLHEAVRILAS
ncbi:hypothetical protein [Fischerella sp. PCC 9605]|uniref:hypothetical protein n=1 Tax=Fischerella sp. PCC 9605 TaxID=1173024 RepID=UPI00047CE707|nr:hypothetical protein [Fischerella sp. PCC 9605]